MSISYAPTRNRGQIDPEKSRRWDSRLERYRDARAEGIQPTSTTSQDIDRARRISDETGRAFSARRA